ncbi:hypothetical protein BJX99DRAFT_238559 [Aspergillus californicus]
MGNSESKSISKDEKLKAYLKTLKFRELDEKQTADLWHIKEKARFPTRGYLESFLEKYKLCHPSVRARFDLILLYFNFEERVQQALLDIELLQGQDEITKILETLRWDFRQTVTVLPSLDCDVDWVLRYGVTEHLEINLVVVEKQVAAMNEGTPNALAAMSMIHRARKKVGRNAEIFGITTDTHEWKFEHLDNKSQHASLILNWANGQQEEIIDQWCKILDQAIIRNVTEKDAYSKRKEQKLASCRVMKQVEQ